MTDMDEGGGGCDSMQLGYGVGLVGGRTVPGAQTTKKKKSSATGKSSASKGGGSGPKKATAKAGTSKGQSQSGTKPGAQARKLATAVGQVKPASKSTLPQSQTKSNQLWHSLSEKAIDAQQPGGVGRPSQASDAGPRPSQPVSNCANQSQPSTISASQSQPRVIPVSQSQPTVIKGSQSQQPRTILASQSQQPRTIVVSQSQQPRTILASQSPQPRTIIASQSQQPRTIVASHSQPRIYHTNEAKEPLLRQTHSENCFDRQAEVLDPPAAARTSNFTKTIQMVTRLDLSANSPKRSEVHAITINNQLKDDVTNVVGWDNRFRPESDNIVKAPEKPTKKRKKKKLGKKPNDFVVLSVMGCIFNPLLATLALFLSIRSQQAWETGNRPVAMRYGILAFFVATAAILSAFAIFFVVCWYLLPFD